MAKIGFLLFAVICAQYANLIRGSKQRVVINGTLLCGDKPYEGAIVKLVDKDVVSDDLMGKMTTGKDGTFYLDGTENEIMTIDAALRIFHDCDDTALGVPIVTGGFEPPAGGDQTQKNANAD